MEIILRICFHQFPGFPLTSLPYCSLGFVIPSQTWKTGSWVWVGLPSLWHLKGREEQLYGFLIDKIPSFLGQEVDSLEEQIFS
jgi:hypothetical protein